MGSLLKSAAYSIGVGVAITVVGNLVLDGIHSGELKSGAKEIKKKIVTNKELLKRKMETF